MSQALIDRYYRTLGKPCCAGCDHWRWYNAATGECVRSAPVSANERLSFLGMEGLTVSSRHFPAGHILTNRDYVCGEFVDSYDWNEEGEKV